MTSPKYPHSVLLDKVFQLICEKVDQKHAPIVKSFAEALFSNISLDDLDSRSDSDLYGATLSLWNEFVQFDSAEPSIKVFNPDLQKNGWQSTHTIVEIIVQDMPFLVDSVRMTLNRLGVTSHLTLHAPMEVQRGKENRVENVFALTNKKGNLSRETIFLIEIDRQTKTSDLKLLSDELRSVVADVSLAVNDWQPMRSRLKAIIDDYKNQPNPNTKEDIEATVKFLTWLQDHNFTLMGYKQYTASPQRGDYKWLGEHDTCLGLMRNEINKPERLLSELPKSAQVETLSKHPLILTKTNTKSRMHRPAYMDYVGIKRFDQDGNVVGEDRFIGLYSAAFYNSSATQVPVLQQKLERLATESGFSKGSHTYKAFLNILETYPRDELLQAEVKDLGPTIVGILQMQERGISKLFVRRDVFGRFFSCMVYVPRERYNTQLRKETQQLFQQAFNSDQEVEFTTYFSESVYARTHYIVRVADNNVEMDVKKIEKNMIELSKSWNDKLKTTLLTEHGEVIGKKLEQKYGNAFSRSYKEYNLPSTTLVDIEKLERLDESKTLDMLFYRPQEEGNDSDTVKLKLFHKKEPIHLSDVLPMLEHFGLRVVDESPYQVKSADGEVNWIMDFSMLHQNHAKLDFERAQTLFQDAFSKVWYKQLADDSFNKLVLGAGLLGRKVTILRAFAQYMRQTGSSFSQSYIASTLASYPQIASMLIALFDMRFNPDKKRDEKAEKEALEKIEQELELVSNLDDDRIIRRYLDMIMATVRTNFYQRDEKGEDKSYVSFKFQPELIPDMPLPLPKFEIFVYSPRVEGVHLRGGKVARGGLRWSDRREDFRTEVLGLVKAQQVKNTVIVPVGAKGGFVCKQLAKFKTREEKFKEGQECYKIFIRSLLDITDNIKQGEVVYPDRVVRLDDDDPYLVVAADKGTATFSDIANGISEEYEFWLGDAFASGGSVGYDHKGMGITARGGWESVKRHFREMDIDCQTTDFTCIGIGDMSGDVFGNGMLLSEHTRLICAFNHLHIFFDPNPDAKASYQERKRLFEDPSLSWADYSSKLISKGGGIFERSVKSISLTPEMQKWLSTKQTKMTPNELIHNVLKMPVDLFWNGGIGTYIKGSKESHAEVGDRANDGLRVNGADIQAKIVGEGGNLGATQLGRIEFASKGGRINTDFIDNVGGVDCSDNEVNIKILLNTLVSDGDLTVKQRNELLYAMTDDVAELVIQDCYRQTQSISITEQNGSSLLKEQTRFIHGIEKQGKLNRDLEFLPSDDEISERLTKNQGLTRPELSVLIAYAKMLLKEELNIPQITNTSYYNQLLVTAFPKVLRERYVDQMQNHPLKGEIIATKLANNMINDMGINFAFRMEEETGAKIDEIVKAYSVATEVFNMQSLWESVQALDNKISAKIQLSMLGQMRRSVRRATRWFLRHGDLTQTIEEQVKQYVPAFNDLHGNILDYLAKDEAKSLEAEIDRLVKQSVPQDVAYRVATLSNMFPALDISQVAEKESRPISLVAKLYFTLGAELEIHWFLEQINQQAVSNHWQALARASFREELDWQQRVLTGVLLGFAPQDQVAQEILEKWMARHTSLLERWNHMMSEFKTSSTHEFAKFSVALRELMLLSLKCH